MIIESLTHNRGTYSKTELHIKRSVQLIRANKFEIYDEIHCEAVVESETQN